MQTNLGIKSKECAKSNLGERENGTGSRLKVGWGMPGKLQLMLM